MTVQPRMTQVGMKALVSFAKDWKLTASQQCQVLGGIPRSRYYRVLNGTEKEDLDDVLERLSLLAGIWRDLEILSPNREASTRWMTVQHPDLQFGGGSPLEWILAKGDSGLADVRRYLETWRFGI